MTIRLLCIADTSSTVLGLTLNLQRQRVSERRSRIIQTRCRSAITTHRLRTRLAIGQRVTVFVTMVVACGMRADHGEEDRNQETKRGELVHHD